MQVNPVVVNPKRTDYGSFISIVREVAECLGCSPEDLFNEDQLNMSLEKSTFECLLNQEQMERLERGHPDATVTIEVNERKALLNDALGRLSERDREVIQLRYGIGRDDDSLTLAEIAAKYGVAGERIRQIEKRAIRKLRDHELNSRLVEAVERQEI